MLYSSMRSIECASGSRLPYLAALCVLHADDTAVHTGMLLQVPVEAEETRQLEEPMAAS